MRARHVVAGFFGRADFGDSNWILARVVKCVHARLPSITEEGWWREDDKFEYARLVYKRTAGASAGRVIASYVEQMQLHQEWFQDLKVY
jgi:hypothetical protein